MIIVKELEYGIKVGEICNRDGCKCVLEETPYMEDYLLLPGPM